MYELLQTTITFLVMGALCSLLERLWPYNVGKWRPDTFTDVTYFAIRIALSASLAVATGVAGQSLPEREQSLIGSSPFAVQLVGYLFLSDFIQYWTHAIMHRVNFLWHVHAIHHSPVQVDWLVASRVHPIELGINKAVSAIPLYFIGFSPSVIAFAVPITACYSLFLHANVPWTYGPFGYIFASPAFHHWHHASDPPARDKNFAQTFSLIDYLFRTAYFPRNRRVGKYGLVKGVMPAGFIQQCAYPLRVWFGLAQSSEYRNAEDSDSTDIEVKHEVAVSAGQLWVSQPERQSDE